MLSTPTHFQRTIVLVALMVMIAPSTLAQDRDQVDRPVGAFDKIEFSIPGTLHFRQGEERSVEVEAPRDVLEQVVTTVEGSDLEIRSEGEGGWLDWFGGSDHLEGDQIDVFVTASTIEKLSLAGSGRIVGETPVEGESLSLSIAGSGGLDLQVAVKRLDVHVAGSGDSTLRGQADAVSTNTAGSGDIRAEDLNVRTAEVSIAGSGDVAFHVTDQLEAQIFGSGDVRYRGRPSVEVRSLGSGEVHSIE